jgi:FdhE protein
VASRILQPGEIEAGAGDFPFLRMPARGDLFRSRADRFRQLALDHTIGDFLGFMAQVAAAQQEALARLPPVPLPDAEQIALCRAHGMPPLPASHWARDPAWQRALAQIMQAVYEGAPQPAQRTITRVQAMRADELERMADALLDGRFHSMDAGATPFLAAALQSYWVHMVASLGSEAFGPTDMTNLCPVCGSPPVASIVRIGGKEQGLRFLHCSLCGSEWHMVRAKCSNCESNKGIGYYGIEGDKGAIKAEACDECGSYLKLLNLEKDHQLDPVADDLASLALDIKMDEAGIHRSGPNLFLISD